MKAEEIIELAKEGRIELTRIERKQKRRNFEWNDENETCKISSVTPYTTFRRYAMLKGTNQGWKINKKIEKEIKKYLC